jgi:small subunit ribosomal protein S6
MARVAPLAAILSRSARRTPRLAATRRCTLLRPTGPGPRLLGGPEGKETSLRAYELMIIFDPDLDDAGIQGMLNRIGEMVGAGTGKIASTDRWGRRKIAYQMNKRSEGYYVVLEITTEANGLPEVDRALRLSDGVLRHKVLRLPPKEAARRGLVGASAGAS